MLSPLVSDSGISYFFFMKIGGRHQGIAGLVGKCLHVLDGAAIGGNHLEHLAGGHVGQRLLGLHDGQRAGKAARVEFLVKIHDSSIEWRRKRAIENVGSRSRIRNVAAAAVHTHDG